VEYLYSAPEGSFIQLDNSLSTELFMTHSVIAMTDIQVAEDHHVDVLAMLVGIGKTQATACLNSSHLRIFVVSDNLTESLADHDCEEKDRNAIVARIARITITTISSTNVNQGVFSFWFLVFVIGILSTQSSRLSSLLKVFSWESLVFRER
jgi:hypothetical protein